MIAQYIYQTIIEDLTRRFDRIESALEALLDLNLPEWARVKVTAALHYAECSIEDRDSLDEMAAGRCVCETLAVRAGDPDEPGPGDDDTQNDYADDPDPDAEDDAGDDDQDDDDEDDGGEPFEDEFDSDGASHSPNCPCGQHPAPAIKAVVQPAPLIAEPDEPFRLVFGNPAHIALARTHQGRR